jgi:glutamate synthase domain-containing protein 2
VLELYSGGVKVIHLCADAQGCEIGVAHPRFIKEVLREVHTRLVQEGVRDEVTLIAGGGIALAEHMAKAIICGADLVAVGAPLMVALGCRVCGGDHDESCPIAIQEVEVDYAAQRMVNLMGAWHSQLIEVLGAMGIREVRRLRGETGRAMFLEDLDREAFGDIGY